MILLVVFLCGGVVMAFEIVGSRLLSPEFGSAVNVWASLISVLLAALSLGGYLGGWLAERVPKTWGLSLVVLCGGGCILIAPAFSKPLCVTIAQRYYTDHHNPVLAPLLASIILFSPACLLFGMVSPYAIKLKAGSQSMTGRVAGRVYAASNLGSVVGTLLPAFYLLPNYGVREIMAKLSITAVLAALLLAAPSLFANFRRLSKPLLILAPLSFASPANAQVLFETNTAYHHIVVEDRGSVRWLKFDNSWQSAVDLKDPDKAIFLYTDYVHLAFVFKQDIKSALMLGLGGGTIPQKFHRDYKDISIDIAEIDPQVKRVAQEFFRFKEDERMKVFILDGRVFLRRTEKTYDLIVMDAYHASRYGIALPFHLCTKEFFEIARSKLSNDGVLVFNLIGTLEGRKSKMTRAVIKTMKEVFKRLYIFPVEYRRYPDVTSRRNIMVFATNGEQSISPQEIIARAHLLSTKRVKVKRLSEHASDLYHKPLRLRDAPLLTDDYAPVEFLPQ